MNRFFDDLIRDRNNGAAVNLLKALLWIVSLLYGCGVRVVQAAYDLGLFPRHKLPRPVVSVGNITVGGSGKTPLVIWLARRLQKDGYRVAVLTRGYRSQNHEEGNDEVAMMRELCPDVPVIVGKDRVATAMQFLFSHDVDVFLMDDGFQHRRLRRDLDLVAVESLNGFGNGHLLPRGILREPLSSLHRADVVVLTKTEINPEGQKMIEEAMLRRGIVKPMLHARQVVTGFVNLKNQQRKDAGWLKDQNVLALSSIADPAAFESTLQKQGARISSRIFYPDHYHYGVEDVQQIVNAARQNTVSVIVTTHKDAVKLEALISNVPREIDIWVLNIDVEMVDHENILFQRIHSLLRA